MCKPIVFIFTLKIREGALDGLKSYLREMNEFVEANEPRVIAYTQFIDEAGTELTDIQVHPDSDSMESHMEVASQRITEAFQYVETTRVEVYGTLNEPLLEQMRQVAGSGVPVSIKAPLDGFSRMNTASRTL